MMYNDKAEAFAKASLNKVNKSKNVQSLVGTLAERCMDQCRPKIVSLPNLRRTFPAPNSTVLN